MKYTNIRNFPVNFSIRGQNYHADVGGDVKIPASHVDDESFQAAKKDLAEVK